MKIVRLMIFYFLLFCFIQTGKSQETTNYNSTFYGVEAFGSGATGDQTPFWIASNRYGMVPLESGNGHLRPYIKHQQQFGKGFFWSTGIDMVVAAPRYRNVYMQQAYAEIGYKNIQLIVGSKEQHNSLWDNSLTTGDMIFSTNARPMPEINIIIPRFMAVPYTKGWFQIKGNAAVGRSFDTDYLRDFIKTDQTYNENVLWHHKAGHFRIKDTRGNFPLYIAAGMRHIAQWGGTSTDPTLGKQPQSFKDFYRVFFARSGGKGSSESDSINVLGAHHISYDFQIGFEKDKWGIEAFYQHIASDKSGFRFDNKTDGLWGLKLNLYDFPWLRKVLVEYIVTRDQSGPFHYIDFDHDAHPGRGGGGDNYYNNYEYSTGLSYFNRGIGSPLLPSPEYNSYGSLGFRNTRIEDWHFGFEGNIHSRLSYRALITFMNGWGTPKEPFLKKKTTTSFLVEMNYMHPRLQGWTFTGMLAGDTGDMFGDKSYGISLRIKKEGILKEW